MSFTLMRYKDGQPKPIKMSIWDAFKGAPPPKARLHQQTLHWESAIPRGAVANDEIIRGEDATRITFFGVDGIDCCRQFHKPNLVGSGRDHLPSTLATVPSKATDVATGVPTDEAKPSTSNSPFTAEEEARLLQMRSENPTESWRITLANLGKPDVQPGIAKARFKEIQTKRHCGEESIDKASNAVAEKDKNQVEKHKDQNAKNGSKSKNENLASKATGSDGEGAKGKTGSDKDEKKGDRNDHSDRAPEQMASAKTNETEIKAWVNKYDKQKWVAIASKHFDITGQRITPQEAQKIAENR